MTDTDLANSHYRVVGGDRLLWSGHATTWEADPRRFVKPMQADIAAIYPQLGQVEVEHVWSGVLGNRAAPHAADRRAVARAVAGQRLRRPRPQHHRHGRQC